MEGSFLFFDCLHTFNMRTFTYLLVQDTSSLFSFFPNAITNDNPLFHSLLISINLGFYCKGLMGMI